MTNDDIAKASAALDRVMGKTAGRKASSSKLSKPDMEKAAQALSRFAKAAGIIQDRNQAMDTAMQEINGTSTGAGSGTGFKGVRSALGGFASNMKDPVRGRPSNPSNAMDPMRSAASLARKAPSYSPYMTMPPAKWSSGYQSPDPGPKNNLMAQSAAPIKAARFLKQAGAMSAMRKLLGMPATDAVRRLGNTANGFFTQGLSPSVAHRQASNILSPRQGRAMLEALEKRQLLSEAGSLSPDTVRFMRSNNISPDDYASMMG